MNNILLLSSSQQFDIFALTETWLSENHYNAEMFDNQLFNVFRKDRCQHTTGLNRGGGVLLAIRSSLLCMLLDLPSSTIENNSALDIDQLIVRVTADNMHDVYVIISYIPPKSSFELYKTHIDNCSFIINNLKENQHIIILGDFNLPNINWLLDSDENCLIPFNVTSECESVVVDTLAELGLKQINNFRNKLNRFLDLVFIDNEFSVSIDSPMPPPVPNSEHHLALCMSFTFYKYLKQTSVVNKQYNFNKCNFNEISNFISRIDWVPVLNNLKLVTAFDKFNYLIKEAIDLHTPKSLRQSSSKPYWYNTKLININNRKNKAFKLYRQSNNNCLLYDRYLQLQRQFDFLNKFLYNQYVLSMETKLKKNSKCFWMFINNKKRSTGIPNSIHYLGETSSDTSRICNLFANFFRSVFKPPDSGNAPDVNISHEIINIGDLQVRTSEVEEELKKLNEDKQPGFDGIAPVVLKKCASVLAIPLQIIFNRSLREGEFLSEWKISFISPIFKSGSRNEVTNYRPICKISVIPKLFEKIIYNKLVFLLKEVISPLQHGFISGRSTTTNLTIFSNYVLGILEKGLQCDVVYTDFSKAFDKVNHSLLVSKLKNLGFHSNLLRWFESYLVGRVQYVRINNILSDPVEATSGVPQGSHLGPILFLIFINDIPSLLKNCFCLMYADDLKLFLSIRTISDCIHLQNDLSKLNAWCVINDLHLNVSKCQSMTFCRSFSPIIYPYNIEGISLSRVDEKKDLGVIFDRKCTFISHIDYVVAKASSMLGFISRNSKDFSDPFTFRSLYFSYVRSILEYCCTIWNPIYAVHSTRIERIQKRFTRVAIKILRWNVDLPSYSSRCLLLGIQTLESRRKYFDVMFVRDVINYKINCPDLLSLINLHAPCHELRHNIFFYVPFHRVNYGNNEPITRCLRQANSVCCVLDFNMYLSRDSFKKQLLSFMNTGG